MTFADISIRECSVADVEQSGFLSEMLEAYGNESSIKEIGNPEPDFEMYRSMEASGVLHAIGAFADDLVGVAFLFIYCAPHYKAQPIATTESIFVLPEYRRGGTGKRLLLAVESKAKELGALALLVSSPRDGRLEKMLPHNGYRETNRVFTKGLS